MISPPSAPARPVAASTASLRAPYVDPPPADTVGPDERHDAGWLGQVPPPARREGAATTGRRPSDDPACVEDVLTGSNALRDREEAGWLGQVPPPPSRCEAPETPREIDERDRLTEFPTPEQAHEEGWLGQVPPTPRAEETAARGPEPEYAIPGLAPDPWLDPGTLYPSDPTLFG